ncbi:MAG: hypothetical protein LBH95_05560 [Oscillospiraceae bacterium]|jgi:capsular polysaccharide biosynthesis protein|nr:hypothetical protein [Oscillospiraceae bacterium]
MGGTAIEQDMTVDLRVIFSLIKKNTPLIILLAVFGAAAAFSVSEFLLIPKYEASVTLVVNTRDEQATVITNDQINSAKQLVNTYAVVLTNDTLLEEIIQILGLNDSVESLNRRISADVVNQTQVMRMTMRDENPDIAKAVLEEIMARAPDLLVSTVKAGSVEIVSPPKINYRPVSPRVSTNTAMGALLGVIAALAYAFIKKAVSNTFISDEDINKYLELPVLGVIPSVEDEE